MARTLFIHCGLHKTGTTALQVVLERNRAALRQGGLLYPESRNAGFAGHHNLAWALTGDWRYDRAGLTAPRVAAEIAEFDGNAVLSSEDFEFLLLRPDALEPMLGALAGAARSVRLVLYYRDPRAYAVSLYAELLRHGYAKTFRAFSNEIAETRQIRHGTWLYQFDHAAVTEAISAWRPGCLIARNYDALNGRSVTADFLEVTGTAPAACPVGVTERHHARLPLPALAGLFAGNCLGRALRDREKAAIRGMFADADGHDPEQVFSGETIAEIVRRGRRSSAS